MDTKFIEAGNEKAGGLNHGKFMVARFSFEEWHRYSAEHSRTDNRLLRMVGWTQDHILVMDLQTGEGAIFKPGGFAKADLNKHRIWVCPMFEPFLEWLYKQDLSDIWKLPSWVDIEDPRSALSGYRRPGPEASPAHGKKGD